MSEFPNLILPTTYVKVTIIIMNCLILMTTVLEISDYYLSFNVSTWMTISCWLSFIYLKDVPVIIELKNNISLRFILSSFKKQTKIIEAFTNCWIQVSLHKTYGSMWIYLVRNSAVALYFPVMLSHIVIIQYFMKLSSFYTW